MKPLAVTGLGVVSPWDAMFARTSVPEGSPPETFAAPTLFDGTAWPGASVAEVRDFDASVVLGDKGLRNLDRLTRLFLVASRRALEDAGLRRDGAWQVGHGSRAGVCASTAYGSFEAMMELHRVAVLESPRYLNPARFPNTVINAALGYVSIWEDLRAVNTTVCNGNCGALDAVLCAETYLASRRADTILVGGAEALHEGLLLAFRGLDALARDDAPYLPGDPRSSGMRLGEGAAMLVLEDAAAARDRGAHVLGDVVGYGTSFEPPESEALIIHLEPDPLARAIRSALDDAGLAPSEIAGVVRCANGHPRFDVAETAALHDVFGQTLPDAVAPKALLGESFGAGGAFGMATALGWFRGLGGALGARRASVGGPVLVTALGFYGNASAVVLRAPGAGRAAHS